MKTLGEKLVAARNSQHLTQNQLAQRINVARTTISNWENGRSQPDFDALRALSDVLHYDFLGEHHLSSDNQEEKTRKSRLKLTNDPLIEIVAPENSSIFAAGSIDFRVDGSDSHGNPVNFRIFANFRVENNAD